MAGIFILGFCGVDVEFVLQNFSVTLLSLLANVGVVKSALETTDTWKCQCLIAAVSDCR